MKHHSELINYLLEKFELESYLEIGTFNRAHNFDLINAEEKFCVDPDPNAGADYGCTSDEFFDVLKQMYAHKPEPKKFDLIFIDGLHHADQVKKDFENALEHLSENGFIVLHDCNPPTEKTTCVPRGSQREWCGNVYQFACRLSEYDGINFLTFDFDYGCAVVWREEAIKGEPVNHDITWDYFQANKQLIRLTPVESIDTLFYTPKTAVNHE